MYEIYQRLLDEKGLKNADISRGTGVSNMTLSYWKRGKSTPKYENMKKIAQFLDVTVEYLTGEEDDNSEKYYINDETEEIAQEIFENKELRLLFDAAKDAQPEDLQTVHQMLLALKRKERGDIDWLSSATN